MTETVTETVTDRDTGRDIHRDENVTRAQPRARGPSPTHKNTRAVTSTTDAAREPFEPNSPDLELPDIVKNWP